MKKYRQHWIVSCVLIVAGIGGASFVLWVIWALFFSCDADDTYLLHTFTTQQGYVVEIRRDCFSDMSETRYAKILKDGQAIFPLKFLGYTGGSVRFSLIEAGEQQQIIALIDKATPFLVLAIYDVQTLEAATHLEEKHDDRPHLLRRLNEGRMRGEFFKWANEASKRERLQMRISG